MAALHQRIGVGEEQVVDVIALLGPGFQHIAEPRGGDEAQLRALALDHRVGDEGGAVHNFCHRRKVGAVPGDDMAQPVQRADRRVLRRGEALVQMQGTGGRVGEDEVGEGATNVEAQAEVGGHGGLVSS